MRFRTRDEAGRQLAGALARPDPGDPPLGDPVVLALPRGGVPVAAPVARAFGAPLDLLLVRKIGVPSQPELAAAAVVDGPKPEMVVNEDVVRQARIAPETLAAGKRTALDEIARRRDLYLRGRAPVAVADRDVILVDDGIATGATMLAGTRATRARSPRSITLAVPVASRESLDRLRPEVDRVACLSVPSPFYGVGAHFLDFHQLTDAEVCRLLDEAAGEAGRGDGKLDGPGDLRHPDGNPSGRPD